MSIVITGDETPSIDFAPKTTVAEVVQNVRTILGTIKYQIPLDREFGIDGTAVDRPMPQAKAMLTTEIIKQIKRYEPRATVKSIDFTGGLDGKLIPRVEVEISETQ